MPAETGRGSLVYQESILGYVGRKHFYFVLPSSALLLVAVSNLVFFWGSIPPIQVLALDAGVAAGVAWILMKYLPSWRFRRFRIYDDGFVLPGFNRGPKQQSFLPFKEVQSVEGTGWVHGDSFFREGVRIHLVADPEPGGSRYEILISAEELSRRNLLRLWDEFVSRGLATKESLETLSQAR